MHAALILATPKSGLAGPAQAITTINTLHQTIPAPLVTVKFSQITAVANHMFLLRVTPVEGISHEVFTDPQPMTTLDSEI